MYAMYGRTDLNVQVGGMHMNDFVILNQTSGDL